MRAVGHAEFSEGVCEIPVGTVERSLADSGVRGSIGLVRTDVNAGLGLVIGVKIWI